MGTCRVLAVDDEELIRQLLADVLSASGFSVITACSAEAALEQLRQQPIDVVISDIQMPGVNGFDLLRAVRLENIPVSVILLTGFNIDAARKMARLRGADGFLSKPFRIDDMVQLLRDVTARRKASGHASAHSPEARGDEP